MKRLGGLCGFACILSIIFAGMPFARAEGLEKAIAAVNGASDEELRKEFERRFAPKKSRSRAIMAVPRSANPGEAQLASVGDADLVAAAQVRTRAIYGVDDRKDWYQISSAEGIEPLTRASAALFNAAKVEPPVNGRVHLTTSTFADVQKLCLTPKPKFADQPSGAFCSGTLVRPDVVLTAGHCVREVSGDLSAPEHVTGIKFVFGYLLQNADTDATTVPAANVFTGKEVVGGERQGKTVVNRHDWALVRLDRPVPASIAEPVTSWENKVTLGEPVFVIGFPAGMPLKYAPGAKIRDDSNEAWFVANLDTFGGNSGSGVYDQISKKLIGILVQGETDYVLNRAKNCYIVNLCPNDGCLGETVSRISQVSIAP